MRRLAKTIGATVLPRLTPPSADEMGFCDKVRVRINEYFFTVGLLSNIG
jgi:hypothetical protein